jgi:hypothetical protein
LLLDLLPGFQTADLVLEICRIYLKTLKSGNSRSISDRELSGFGQFQMIYGRQSGLPQLAFESVFRGKFNSPITGGADIGCCRASSQRCQSEINPRRRG